MCQRQLNAFKRFLKKERQREARSFAWRPTDAPFPVSDVSLSTLIDSASPV